MLLYVVDAMEMVKVQCKNILDKQKESS